MKHPKGKSMLQMYRYSDELANGDTMDDRDIHEDEDMNDDVVDYNGQTNAGYGSAVPESYFANNHINSISPGHFMTEALQHRSDMRLNHKKHRRQHLAQYRPYRLSQADPAKEIKEETDEEKKKKVMDKEEWLDHHCQ
jgi:hypothetical protein